MSDQDKTLSDHEKRLLCLENCVEGLMEWQRRQNGTLKDLDAKVDELLLREAKRDGAIRALQWSAGFVGFAGIANLVAVFVR